MNEPVRWVTKAEAAEEMEISLSTLDRKIRSGEIEVAREGRRVYVRMPGPEYLSDEELLRRADARERELQRTVRELEQNASEVEAQSVRAGAGAGRGQGVRSHRQTAVPRASEGVPEGGRRAQGDEGVAQHGPRDRLRAVGAADRQRSAVVVRAEVGAEPSAPRRSRQPPIRPLAFCQLSPSEGEPALTTKCSQQPLRPLICRLIQLQNTPQLTFCNCRKSLYTGKTSEPASDHGLA